jgi:hypothetical protein
VRVIRIRLARLDCRLRCGAADLWRDRAFGSGRTFLISAVAVPAPFESAPFVPDPFESTPVRRCLVPDRHCVSGCDRFLSAITAGGSCHPSGAVAEGGLIAGVGRGSDRASASISEARLVAKPICRPQVAAARRPERRAIIVCGRRLDGPAARIANRRAVPERHCRPECSARRIAEGGSISKPACRTLHPAGRIAEGRPFAAFGSDSRVPLLRR